MDTSTAEGGARVAQLRKTRDLTQAALARRAGISVGLLSKIEVGDRTLTPTVAVAIARALRIAPIHQAWAAAQQPLPTAAATANRAGAFLQRGDFAGGLAVVDQGIIAAATALSGPEKTFATGRLHLTGMTLAGRLGERAQTQQHMHAAQTAAEQFPHDLRLQAMLFGPARTTTDVLATEGDLGRPRNVIRLSEELFRTDTGLPANRICSTHISTARAHLDLGHRDNAETSLLRAWH
ncbi:MAG: helix-turn-helix domain-containing protein, partial [Pseudonocardiaceae bacterium]